MLRRILVPIAGEQQRDAAIAYAGDLARVHDATLYLLGIIDIPNIERRARAATAASPNAVDEQLARRLDNARVVLTRALTALAKTLSARGATVRSVLDSGAVHEVIASHSRCADLAVIARGANFQFESADGPGDTLLKLLHATSRGTMVVPEGFTEKVEHVVVAHDLGLACARALYTTIHVAPFPGARYTLVHAESEDGTDEHDLSDIVTYMTRHGLSVEVVTSKSDPVGTVLDVVAERRAQAIVMGAHNGNNAQPPIVGHTAAALLEQSMVPILFGG